MIQLLPLPLLSDIILEHLKWYTKPFFFYLLFNGQVGSYAIRDAEEYKNFCDRSKDQRPLPEEVIGVRFLDTFRF